MRNDEELKITGNNTYLKSPFIGLRNDEEPGITGSNTVREDVWTNKPKCSLVAYDSAGNERDLTAIGIAVSGEVLKTTVEEPKLVICNNNADPDDPIYKDTILIKGDDIYTNGVIVGNTNANYIAADLDTSPNAAWTKTARKLINEECSDIKNAATSLFLPEFLKGRYNGRKRFGASLAKNGGISKSFEYRNPTEWGGVINDPNVQQHELLTRIDEFLGFFRETIYVYEHYVCRNVAHYRIKFDKQ